MQLTYKLNKKKKKHTFQSQLVKMHELEVWMEVLATMSTLEL